MTVAGRVDPDLVRSRALAAQLRDLSRRGECIRLDPAQQETLATAMDMYADAVETVAVQRAVADAESDALRVRIAGDLMRLDAQQARMEHLAGAMLVASGAVTLLYGLSDVALMLLSVVGHG